MSCIDITLQMTMSNNNLCIVFTEFTEKKNENKRIFSMKSLII